MSYYYNYYLGYIDKIDGLFYPLGPYDNNGKLQCVFYRSRSFASDLHEDFYRIQSDKYSKQLKEEFSYKDYDGTIHYEEVAYLSKTELPSFDYIKSGYFLIDDVKRYIENNKRLYDLDIFYDYLEPELFAAKQINELSTGIPPVKYDCEGYPLEQHSCSEYMYYAYPDYHSKEYESFLLRTACEMYDDYDFKDKEIIILETEG